MKGEKRRRAGGSGCRVKRRERATGGRAVVEIREGVIYSAHLKLVINGFAVVVANE